MKLLKKFRKVVNKGISPLTTVAIDLQQQEHRRAVEKQAADAAVAERARLEAERLAAIKANDELLAKKAAASSDSAQQRKDQSALYSTPDDAGLLKKKRMLLGR